MEIGFQDMYHDCQEEVFQYFDELDYFMLSMAATGYLYIKPECKTIVGDKFIPSGYHHLACMAAEKGYFNLLKIFLAKNPITPGIVAHVVYGGHLDIYHWLKEIATDDNSLGWRVASPNGKTISVGDPENNLRSASIGGDLDMFRYIYQSIPRTLYKSMYANGFTYIIATPEWRQVCVNLGKHNHLDIITWLESVDKHFDSCVPHITKSAAKHGHINILKSLLPKHISLEIFFQAVSGGQLEVLRWLVTLPQGNHVMKNPKLYTVAVERGYINIMEFLYQQGCNMNETLCTTAAFAANLESLRWLRDHGCPWNARTRYWTVEKKNQEMLQYLDENRCPSS